MPFVWFLVGVGVYVAFLAWCFLIIRCRGPLWTRALRIALGTLLITANLVPLLAWPVVVPVLLVTGLVTGNQHENYIVPVIYFPRTLPIYVENIYARRSGTARRVSIRYPMEISGVRYAPVVRTVCTRRRMFDIDKWIRLVDFDRFPTSEGDGLLAMAGDAVVALDHGHETCSMTAQDHVDVNELQRLPVFVIRGEADKTQVYTLSNYAREPLRVDDIALDPPELVAIDEMPAREVVSLGSLWPMPRPGERGKVPDVARSYRKLPAEVKSCVEFVSTGLARGTLMLEVHRSRESWLPREAKADPDAYCRRELRRLVAMPEMERLQPIPPTPE